MAIFLSTFVNKLDKKGRVSVPAAYRAALSGLSFGGIIAYRSYTNQAVEACGIDVMERMVASVDHFDLFSDERGDLTSTIFADSEQLAFDPEGRIMLPESLIVHAGITDKVSFVGCGSTFQMWEPETFQAQQVVARERLKRRGLTLGLAKQRLLHKGDDT